MMNMKGDKPEPYGTLLKRTLEAGEQFPKTTSGISPRGKNEATEK